MQASLEELLLKSGKKVAMGMEGFPKPEDKEQLLGPILRMLYTAFKQQFVKIGAEENLDEVTLMHGWIMEYLYQNEGRDVYQKTIESKFNIRRSTVSSILQLMEKKGYISREAVDGDARLKKIALTQQGREISVKTKSMIDEIERRLIWDIEPQELEIFYQVAGKIKANLEKELSRNQ